MHRELRSWALCKPVSASFAASIPGQSARAGLYYARLMGDDASRVSRFVVLQ